MSRDVVFDPGPRRRRCSGASRGSAKSAIGLHGCDPGECGSVRYRLRDGRAPARGRHRRRHCHRCAVGRLPRARPRARAQSVLVQPDSRRTRLGARHLRHVRTQPHTSVRTPSLPDRRRRARCRHRPRESAPDQGSQGERRAAAHGCHRRQRGHLGMGRDQGSLRPQRPAENDVQLADSVRRSEVAGHPRGDPPRGSAAHRAGTRACRPLRCGLRRRVPRRRTRKGHSLDRDQGGRRIQREQHPGAHGWRCARHHDT